MISPELRRTAFLRTGRAQSSGYLVAPRLVLTAAHCVGEVAEPVEVRVPESGPHQGRLRASQPVCFHVVARSEGFSGAGDDGFALLSTEEDDPFGLKTAEPVRWGRLTGTDPLPADVLGFPELADADGKANLEHAYGKLIPWTGTVTGEEKPSWHHAFQVESGTPLVGVGGGALWRGASGAALLGEGNLLGLLDEWHHSVEGRLKVIPVQLLEGQKGILDLLAEDGVGPVVFEPMWVGQKVLEPAYDPLPESWSAADLLRARYQVVDFCGREEELGRLMDWCTVPASGATKLSVRLLVGDPAVGKTRLAREFCARMVAQGWVAGLLAPPAKDVSGLMRLDENRLVVVDNSDGKVGQLDALLRHRGGSGRIRVLALARHEGEWWSAFRRRYAELAEEHPFQVGYPDPGARKRIYQQARAAFLLKEREAHGEAADVVPDGEASADLSDPDFANCLFILILALIDVRRTRYPEWRGTPRTIRTTSRAEALYEQALDLEREDWIKHAEKAGLPTDPVLLDRVVAVASLAFAGGDTEGHQESEAARLLRLVPDLGDATEQTRRRFVRFFQERISGYGALRALRPMRLAQHLVSKMVCDFPELISRLLDLDPDRSPDDAAQQALSTLRTMNYAVFGEETHQSPDTVLYRALHDALQEHAPALIRLVRKALETTDNPTGRSLAAALETVFQQLPAERLAAEAAKELEEACPDALQAMTIVLRSKALEFYTAAAPHSRETRFNLGTENRLLSRVLADAGQRRKAHNHAWQAVQWFNALARSDDSHECLLNKAHALSNLGVRNYEVGRFTESLDSAREAVQAYEQLRHDRPDRTHNRYLSQAMCNLSNSLARLGRWREALQYAVDALDLVTDDLPPESAGPPLHSWEITEAKAIALRVLARRQGDVQKFDEAVRSAVGARDLFHGLIKERSGRWDRDYALALVVLGRRYTDAGQWDEGIRTLSQALQMYEELEHQYQEAERPQHADALRDLATAHLGKALARGPSKRTLNPGIRRAEQALRQHDLMAPEERNARRESKSRILCVLAELELTGSKPKQACEHAREALAILDKYVPETTWLDKYRTAILASVYGATLAACGDPSGAAAQHRRANDLCEYLREEESDRKMVELETMLAELEQRIGVPHAHSREPS
ncbi:trypsin-like serine protease [Streptomyces sp. NPDC050549]|uniref:trypsin-like serine protease n=1 Tax=Streptomyces sp. NPDC050549 TaxID=3155406 RepID=UPI0034383BF5